MGGNIFLCVFILVDPKKQTMNKFRNTTITSFFDPKCTSNSNDWCRHNAYKKGNT